MSTIIYLAGPITGVPDYLERFASAAGRLAIELGRGRGW